MMQHFHAERSTLRNPGLARPGSGRLGFARWGFARLGFARLGLARLGCASLVLASLGLAGCERATATTAPEVPVVTVSTPVERQVTDYQDFTGRTDAVQSVAVRARVSGYLTEMPFKEGSEVKTGEILFQIDPRPYRAQLGQATGQYQQALASAELAQSNFERTAELAKRPVAAVTRQDVDTAAANLATAKAQATATKAAVDSAQLNLDFCTIASPIDGRISRYYITVGNLVTQDQTLLTTIVSQDPMYAYFDVDEQTMLDVQKLIRAGKMKSARKGNDVPVRLQLANETGFPHAGTINFVDNRVDPSTGTLQVRGVFPNPLVNGSRVLSPGLFVRVRIFIGVPYQALLVSEEAVVNDQGQNRIDVVNDQDTIEVHNVVLGEVHAGLRVVSEGLKPGQRIVVRGLQRIQPGMKVRARVAEMPQATPILNGTSAAPAGGQGAVGGGTGARSGPVGGEGSGR